MSSGWSPWGAVVKQCLRWQRLPHGQGSAAPGGRVPKSDWGGSIREAGGPFAEREKAKEDQYFYNLQKDQLKRLKGDSKKKIKYHREQIEKHEAAIKAEEDKFRDRQG